MRLSFIQTLLAIAGLSASLANAGTEQISVTRASGAVTAVANGVGVAARVGAKLTPPVTITTGADGAVHLEQNSAALDVGPNSIVELRDDLSKSLVLQRGGRVMYTVKPRKSRDFSVETPYLVAVVKGTVFAVAVADAATQVTLVEGSVELQGEGIAEAVLLQPNQTARRAAGEHSIRVTTIDTTPPTQANLERSQPTALNDAAAAPGRFGELATSTDLNEIAATRLAEQRSRSEENPSSTPTSPTSPTSPTTPADGPNTPIAPTSPGTPTAPTVEPTPGTPGVPITPPATSVPDITPTPTPDADHGQDSDDGNNGNGNDDDRDDDGNPGRNRGKNRAR